MLARHQACNQIISPNGCNYDENLLISQHVIFFILPPLIRIRKALENKNNMEDDRVAILESQLAQAKLIAEEADKKYEEVNTADTSQPCRLVNKSHPKQLL